jgi:hypothetical protein
MSTDWKNHIPEYLVLDQGETQLRILAEPTVTTNQWGREQLEIKTDKGIWRVGVQSPLARELKRIATAHGQLAGTTITIRREGTEKNTRYTLVKATPPPTSQPAQPTLNLEAFHKLPKEEQERLLRKLSLQQ